jgi:2'-5' RNA ligase
MTSRATIPAGKQRIFIGIPLDRQCQKQIGELLKPLEQSRQDIRWVRASNRHLTLAFLGNIPDHEVKVLQHSFAGAYQNETRFQYQLNTLTRFPDAAGRIIALVNDPTRPLAILFQNTLNLLRENRLKPDRKDFRPHITLGRIKKPRHEKGNLVQQVNIKLIVEKVTLFQSQFSESGPEYTSLAETYLQSRP